LEKIATGAAVSAICIGLALIAFILIRAFVTWWYVAVPHAVEPAGRAGPFSASSRTQCGPRLPLETPAICDPFML